LADEIGEARSFVLSWTQDMKEQSALAEKAVESSASSAERIASLEAISKNWQHSVDAMYEVAKSSIDGWEKSKRQCGILKKALIAVAGAWAVRELAGMLANR
jgi:hypothetical protein